MRVTFLTLLFSFVCTLLSGQKTDMEWYSETEVRGITIQNSLPKGGRYDGPTTHQQHCSYLVFFTRVTNGTDSTLNLSINFSSDSTLIPSTTDTYVKLFLPSDTMTMDKVPDLSYGIAELESLSESTCFQREVKPGEDCLFYSVALFYQTIPGGFTGDRGGNRATFVLKGEDLYYNMPPQIPSLKSGYIRVTQ